MRPFDLFSTFNMDRRTDQQAHFPIEMQFYISVMFLGFPDKIHEEQVWSTNRCVLVTFFPTDISSYRDAILHFCDVPRLP